MAKKRLKSAPKKYFKTREDFYQFIDDEKEWLFSRFADAIEEAYRKGHIEAQVLDAQIEETMTIIKMTSKIEEWENSLNLALDWNIVQEKYEICSTIVKLKDEIFPHYKQLE